MSRIIGTSVAAAVAALALVAPAAAASAAATERLAIDFTASGYALGAGSPSGQNGWAGSIGSLDWALVANDDPAYLAAGLPAGGRSLQFSNAAVSGSSAPLVSPLVAPAGESAADNTFDAAFTVASATGGSQPGLNVDVNIDGASRYGGVLNLRHTPDGLAIGSYWVPADATGTDVPDWRSAVFATVPAEVPHTIRVVTVYLPGAPDLFDVYVDGALVSAGSGATTWERYHELEGTGGDRTVDSLSFRPGRSAPSSDGIGYDGGLPAVPGTLDAGFLFTGIEYESRLGPTPVPTAPPATLPPAPDPSPDATLPSQSTKPGETVTATATGFAPFENVYLAWYSTPVFAGWFQADASGTVTVSLAVPDSLDPGTHTLQFTGASGRIVALQLAVLALAASGVEGMPVMALAAGLGLAGAGLLLGARRTPRTAAPRR